jgi:hypothetical protein
MTGWWVASLCPTASTIQSFQTADLRAGSKEAVSVGIFVGIIPLFRSLVTLAVSQADFRPPVSASKNSVPRGRVSTANTFRQPGILGVLGGQERRFEPGP